MPPTKERHIRGVMTTATAAVSILMLLLRRREGSHYHHHSVESFPSTTTKSSTPPNPTTWYRASSSSFIRVDLDSCMPQPQPHSKAQHRLFFTTTKATSQYLDTSSNNQPPPSSQRSVHLHNGSNNHSNGSNNNHRRNIQNAKRFHNHTTNVAATVTSPMVHNITNHNHSSVSIERRSSRKSTNDPHDFRSKLRATRRQLSMSNTTAPHYNNNNNNNNSNTTIPMIQQLSQSYLDYLFAECVAHNEWDLAWTEVVPVMTAVHRSVQYSTYNACFQACFQTGNAGGARRILDTMQESSRSHPHVQQPQINDYTLVLLTMCRNDQSESGWCQKAIQLLEEVKRTTQQDVPFTVYDAIFTRLIPTRQWKMSVQLLQRMENNDNDDATTQPVLSTYRTVIECCVAANQANVAYQVLKSYLQQQYERRRRRPLPPDGEHLVITSSSYLFEMVIVALSKQTQWRRAVQLLDHMWECQVPRTLVLYNSILIACSKAREPVAAKSLYQRLKRDDLVRPNIISYNTAIAACCHDYWRDALLIFDQMQREPGVTPDICTYTNVIRACVKGDKIERAKSLIQVVKAKGLPLDSYFYTAAMEASDWSHALKLLQEMEAKGISPTEVSYSVTIKACGKSGQWEKALDLLEVMRSKKMKINIYVYNAAIGALAKAAKQRMKSIESIDGKLLSTKVQSLFTKIRSDGIEPDGFSYSSAISCYGSEGQWEDALGAIQEMRNGGPNIQPNKVAYTAAISSCGRSGQVDMAIQLFEQMQEQGHTPDTVAYNALFLAFRVAHRTEEVWGLWNEMLAQSRCTTPMATSTVPYFPSSSRIRPDIITVTEAIGALSSDPAREPEMRNQIDQVTSDAVDLGILLRPTHSYQSADTVHRGASTDKDIVYDLSCMSFPVARAACRFILMKRILPSLPMTSLSETNNDSSNERPRIRTVIPDLLFITGSGLQHRLLTTSAGRENRVSSSNGTRTQQPRSMFMREYIQYILLNDFNLVSAVTTTTATTTSSTGNAGRNIVAVKSETLMEWCMFPRSRI